MARWLFLLLTIAYCLLPTASFAQKDNMNMAEKLGTVIKTKAESAKEKVDPQLKGDAPRVIEKPIIEKMDFKEKTK
jgi:hypothetical protein